MLELWVRDAPEGAEGEMDPAAARAAADGVLAELGLDLNHFEEPVPRRLEEPDNVRVALRYRDREAALGAELCLLLLLVLRRIGWRPAERTGIGGRSARRAAGVSGSRSVARAANTG